LLIQLYILLFNFKNKNYNKLSTSYLTYKVLDHQTMSHQCISVFALYYGLDFFNIKKYLNNDGVFKQIEKIWD
jgi:hypothetical protein